MLNKKEQSYFNAIKTYIARLFCVPVGIYPLDHKAFIPMEEGEEILGCCHKLNDDKGDLVGYVITIDEPYIKSCYNGRQAPYSPFSDNQLIETICHEIAHIFVWEHNKEHKNLTNELYDTAIYFLEKK